MQGHAWSLLVIAAVLVPARGLRDAGPDRVRSREATNSGTHAPARDPSPEPTSEPSYASAVAELKAKMAEREDVWARPDTGTATRVNITLNIRHVNLNEMESTVSVTANLKLEWRDKRKMWANSSNPAHRRVNALYIDSSSIWHPDIVHTNSLAGKGASVIDGVGVKLDPDGRAQWTLPAHITAFCQMDLKLWPFEDHVCRLSFGSNTLDRNQLKFELINYTMQVPGPKAGQTGEFILDDVIYLLEERLEDGSNQPFDSAVFLIYLHREPGAYKAIIFTPAAVVIILCMSTFMLPPRAGEKIILGGVNAMLICLFLIYFAHSLPVLTNQTPFIVVFYSASLYLVCFSLVAAVVVLNISRQSHSTKLPSPVKSFLTGTLCRRLLCIPVQEFTKEEPPKEEPHSSSATDEHSLVLHEEMSVLSSGFGSDPGSGQQACSQGATDPLGKTSTLNALNRRVNLNKDWLLLALAIDRILMLVYIIVFTALGVACNI